MQCEVSQVIQMAISMAVRVFGFREDQVAFGRIPVDDKLIFWFVVWRDTANGDANQLESFNWSTIILKTRTVQYVNDPKPWELEREKGIIFTLFILHWNPGHNEVPIYVTIKNINRLTFLLWWAMYVSCLWRCANLFPYMKCQVQKYLERFLNTYPRFLSRTPKWIYSRCDWNGETLWSSFCKLNASQISISMEFSPPQSLERQKTVAGDAMRVMGPFLGQGGSCGLEDSVVLAWCLNSGAKLGLGSWAWWAQLQEESCSCT